MSTPSEIYQPMANYAELAARFDGKEQKPQAPGLTVLGDFSDELCKKLYERIFIPSGTKDLVFLQKVLFHFFQFYTKGVLPEGVTIQALVFSLLATTQNTSEGSLLPSDMFFPPEKFQPSGFFPLPSLPDIKGSKLDTWDPIEPKIPAATKVSQTPEDISNKYLSSDVQDTSRFIRMVQLGIMDFTNGVPGPKFRGVHKMTIYLGLLLMRSLIKDDDQMNRAFTKKVLTEHLKVLAGWPTENGYQAPCGLFLKLSRVALTKGDPQNTSMFLLILGRTLELVKDETLPRFIIPTLYASLLTHTMCNGLGLVYLMGQAALSLSTTYKELMERTLNTHSQSSWWVLSAFISKFMDTDPKKKSFSVFWGRVVSDGYLTDYSARYHAYLCGVFGAISDFSAEEGTIQDSIWFQSNRSIAMRGYAWGVAVVEQNQIERPIALHVESAKIYHHVRPLTMGQTSRDIFLARTPMVLGGQDRSPVRSGHTDPLGGLDPTL